MKVGDKVKVTIYLELPKETEEGAKKEKERIYALFAKKNFLIQIRNLSLVLDGRVFLHLLKIKSYVKMIVLWE